MSEMNPPTNRGPSLHVFGGQEAPPAFVVGWKQIQQLPLKALANFWEILMPVVGGQEGDAVRAAAEAFCEAHGVTEPQLNAALHAGHLIVTRAAAANLDDVRFRADLIALSGTDETGVDVIAQGYKQARAVARDQMIEASLFDHGQVLVGLDWRLDNVMSSDRGVDFGTPVVLLTLEHRKRGQNETTSVYVLPQQIAQLKQTCEQIEAMIARYSQGA